MLEGIQIIFFTGEITSDFPGSHKSFGTSTGGYTQVQRITATCKQKQTPFIRTTKSQLHNVSDRHSTWWKLSSHIFILSPKAANSSWSCSPHTQLKANEFNLYPVKLKESKWIILARVTSPFEAASNSTHRTSQKNFLAHKKWNSKQKNNGIKLHDKLANGPMKTIEKGPTSAPALHSFNQTHDESSRDQSHTKMGENMNNNHPRDI